jgi:peroxidase
MNKTTLERLTKICPNDNAPFGPTAYLDAETPQTIDNVYYKELQLHSGVLQIDQALTSDTDTNAVVNSLAQDSNRFNDQFVAALIKLGNILDTPPTTLFRNVRTLCKNVR